MTANILPLAFDMVPEAYREEVEKNVITGIITRNKGHISSGVIGMNWMMRELTRMGRGDVAFLLASNKTYPSYGYMIEKGATAIWELWNGDTANRWMNSCNHVMILGDLLTWYFRDLAGFNPAQPAYKQIILKPDFSIQELSHVKASHNTLYGKMISNWKKTLTHLEWDITVPCNTTALVYLPTLDEKAVKDKDVTFVRREGNSTVWSVPSGNYHFSVSMDPSSGKNRAGIVEDQFLYEQASFPECHGATIVELKNGDLVASFFGGTKERNPIVVSGYVASRRVRRNGVHLIWLPTGCLVWMIRRLSWQALRQNPLRRMPAPWLLRLKGTSSGHAARLVGILCFSRSPAEI